MSYVAQVRLKLTTKLKMTMKADTLASAPNTEFIGVCHKA